jgi:hypothetical protein
MDLKTNSSGRDLKTNIENVVGRFWIDREDHEVYMGYIDLGIFGRIKNCKLFRSRKRAGKENIDSDFTIVVRSVDTPIGLMRYAKEMIDKAIWEEEPEEIENPPLVGKVQPAPTAPARAPGATPDSQNPDPSDDP